MRRILRLLSHKGFDVRVRKFRVGIEANLRLTGYKSIYIAVEGSEDRRKLFTSRPTISMRKWESEKSVYGHRGSVGVCKLTSRPEVYGMDLD